MIADHDRSGWIGASDTDYVVGNWDTATWEKWMLTKLGIHESRIETIAMNAGTNKEHQILEHIGCDRTDRQILLPEYRLRINLDGEIGRKVCECKTYGFDKGFKLPLKYKRQVWVQMFGAETDTASVYAYGLTDEDYRNYFLPIDENRLMEFPIEYNREFIEKYREPLTVLARCIEEGRLPNEAERDNHRHCH